MDKLNEKPNENFNQGFTKRTKKKRTNERGRFHITLRDTPSLVPRHFLHSSFLLLNS